MPNVVDEGLKLKIMVTFGYNNKWISTKYGISTDWKNGNIFDTGIQIKDISSWKVAHHTIVVSSHGNEGKVNKFMNLVILLLFILKNSII